MNKSAIFKKAHSIAKATALEVGDYRIAFSLALKEVYTTMKNIIATVTASFGNSEITTTIDKKNVVGWKGGSNVRDYFEVESSSKNQIITKFYLIVLGSTRDETVTANGKTFGFVMGFANSKTKRETARSVAQQLAEQLTSEK